MDRIVIERCQHRRGRLVLGEDRITNDEGRLNVGNQIVSRYIFVQWVSTRPEDSKTGPNKIAHYETNIILRGLQFVHLAIVCGIDLKLGAGLNWRSRIIFSVGPHTRIAQIHVLYRE